jgi:DNA-binding LacI/PurR family transcriptional regulator
MTSSDREALGVLEYCRDHKMDIPSAISLIGFDDLDPAGHVHPALTTVHNPVRETALEAARLLIHIIEGKENNPQTIRLDTSFKIRKSLGPVASPPGPHS